MQVLLVEDDEISAGLIIASITERGHQVRTAQTCAEALAELELHTPGCIVLDRGLPDGDGLDLLVQVKANPRFHDVPVLLMTSRGEVEEIRRGIICGAYYYLVKPVDFPMLQAIIENISLDFQHAAEVFESHAYVRRAAECMAEAVFTFRNIDEVRALAWSLSQLCEGADRVRMGLQELMINAVEHGNLEISYQDKSCLMLEGRWEDEIAQRLADQKYAHRVASVRVRRRDDAVDFTIADEGPGFDWHRYLDLDEARALDPNGRGIAMSRMVAFLQLHYEGNGSVVHATANAGQPGPSAALPTEALTAD